MGLSLKVSNQLLDLSKELSADLEKQQHLNVLSPSIFITQTEGMNKWLSLEISSKMGVFTNFKFYKPNTFLSDIFRLAGIVDEQDFTTEKLRWVIFDIFDEVAFKNKFPDLLDYYEGEEVKRLQLATRVADLFDQYLIYRPDYIDKWNINERVFISNSKLCFHEEWQRFLWRRLKEREDFEDKVDLRQKLQDCFQDKDFIKRLKNRFSVVNLFGLSVFTQFHLDLFTKLSEFIDLKFYLLNPSPNEFWYDETNEKSILKISRFEKKSREQLLLNSGNELLSNWGKIGKDTFSSLFESDDFLNVMEVLPSSNSSQKASLLNEIQRDVINNVKNQNLKRLQSKVKDSSITINKCYTPIREIEVLHDYLLSTFQDNDYAPHDVVVLLNDINEYGPYISAVFDNSIYRIPYTIADQSYKQGETITAFLQQFLNLDVNEFTAEKVFELLEFDFIQNKYGISDLNELRRIVKQTNIRFGTVGDKALGTDVLSWCTGIEKLILGFCLGEESPIVIDDKKKYPIDILEGENFYQFLGLKQFVDDLISSIQSRNKSINLSGWKSYIEDSVLDKFVVVNENLAEEHRVILKHLLILDDVEQMTSKISYPVFQKAFLDSLVNNVKSSHFVTGRVTFCSMIPMRSIPFKLVAILGMNSSKFPRREDRLAFDLMNGEQRRGDREIKESDKYLFLETVLSAQEKLYISYIGRNPKNNKEKPPSILIDSLLDYLFDGDEALIQVFVTEHPLHSFSKRYTSDLSKLRTYQHEKNGVNNILGKIRTETNNQKEFRFSELSKYLKDSAGYFFKENYSLYYEDDNLDLLEEENFDFDDLHRFFLKQDALVINKKELLETWQASGDAPLNNFGFVKGSQIIKDVEEFNTLISSKTSGIRSSIDINYTIDGENIEMKIDDIYDGVKFAFSYGKNIKKAPLKILKSLLEYYLLRASGYDFSYHFYYEAIGITPIIIDKNALTQDEAKRNLKKLIQLYKRRNENILIYSPLYYHLVFTKGKKEFSQKFIDSLVAFNPYVKKLEKEGAFLNNKVSSMYDWHLEKEITELIFSKVLF